MPGPTAAVCSLLLQRLVHNRTGCSWPLTWSGTGWPGPAAPGAGAGARQVHLAQLATVPGATKRPGGSPEQQPSSVSVPGAARWHWRPQAGALPKCQDLQHFTIGGAHMHRAVCAPAGTSQFRRRPAWRRRRRGPQTRWAPAAQGNAWQVERGWKGSRTRGDTLG